MRLIDADDVLEGCNGFRNNPSRKFNHGMALVEEIVKNTPTVYVESIRHGHWIHTGGTPKSYTYMCTNCRREAYFPPIGKRDGWKPHCNYKYCPNCGALMDEVEE